MEEAEAKPSPADTIWKDIQKQLRQALGVPEWMEVVHELVPKALQEAYDKGFTDGLAVATRY